MRNKFSPKDGAPRGAKKRFNKSDEPAYSYKKKKNYDNESEGFVKKRSLNSEKPNADKRRFDKSSRSSSSFKKSTRPKSERENSFDKMEAVFQKKKHIVDPDKNIKRRIDKEGSFEHQSESLNVFGKSETIRLNKYIANAGICARRVADKHIAAGEVTVNGEVITAMGYRVKPDDVITFQGKVVQPGKKVYILLNKPKDFITTLDDERGRRTVMELIKGATEERVYPVGRLDRNTTGLLLLTNDGELAQQLTHPSYEIRKVYHVVLNKNITREELNQIKNGIELEDGIAEVDDVDYAGTGLKNEVGIELHSGKNRIVRRIFEHLGFEVIGLDRVLYAGLTKKDLPRGHWRFLTDKEIIRLKHFNKQRPKPRRET